MDDNVRKLACTASDLIKNKTKQKKTLIKNKWNIQDF